MRLLAALAGAEHEVGGPVAPDPLVAEQAVFHADRVGGKRDRQREGVFKGRAGSLPDVGRRVVRRIAEDGHPAPDPGVEGIDVPDLDAVERGFGIDRVEQHPHARRPSRKRGLERLRALRPVIRHARRLRDVDEEVEPAAGDWHHGTPFALGDVRRPLVRRADRLVDRDQPVEVRVPRVRPLDLRPPLGHPGHVVAGERAATVGADQQVGRVGRTVREGRRHDRTVGDEADEPRAEADVVHPKPLHQEGLKVGAGNDVGPLARLLRDGSEAELAECLAGMAVEVGHVVHASAKCRHLIGKPEPVQHLHAI